MDDCIASLVELLMTDDSRAARPLNETVYKTATGELGFRRELTFSGDAEKCPECGADPDRLIQNGHAALCTGCQSFISIYKQKTTITIRK